jgi:hypothetical protein
LQGHDLETSLQVTVYGMPSLMLLELQTFGPYNLLGFSLVPPELRPSVKGLLSFAFSVGLSLAC